MNSLTKPFLAGALVSALSLCAAHGQGFTESDATFYGEIRKSGGGQTVLLQSGRLEMTFVNQSNPANVVTLTTELWPTGSGSAKPYSYALKVPLAYLPGSPRMREFLSISSLPTSFKVQQITIDGTPATLPDGSREFYGLNFASRAGEFRLDLLVTGDSIDADHDGLPDWWERLYGLDPALADGSADFDADGWSNLEEFRRGSNPAESNRVPQLVTSAVTIPESGEAGVFLQVLDSDTTASGIVISLAALQNSAFQLKLDGQPLTSGEPQHYSLAALQSGRLTIAHSDRAVREFSLPVSWSDGGDDATGQVLVRVGSPSATDASEAALWLDGYDLAADGGTISTWADRSGNGRSAMQPTAAWQPMVAGHSADFSKSKSVHLFFHDAALPAGDHTVLAAYQAAGSSDEPQTLLSTNRGFLQLAATTRAISYPGAPVWQMDGLAVRGFENTAGKTTTSIFRRASNRLQNIFGLSYDGENTALTEIEPVLPTLGARRAAVPSGSDPIDQVFGGRLHELLVFPNALPEQKLRDVHDYLESKWGGAVIWDFSTQFKAVVLTAASGTQRHIVRGGFGDDQLGGGSGDDTLSGGGGDDLLSGGDGADRFVFGEVDTGRDRLTDFDLEHDIIDLSALFWGMTGDAREFVSVRLDANYATPVPTLDSALIVKRAGGASQEIVLQNTVVSATQLIRLVVEGRLRMGSLSIPESVQLALASGSTAPLRESLDESFAVRLTRSGAGVPGALDVPLGFFEDALGGRFVVDGATSNEGRRAVVNFARGETSKTLTIRPVPDLETAEVATVQVAVLPHFKYAISGAPVEQAVTDTPMVWLEITQANAVAATAQPARVRLHRDGNLTQSLTVDLQLGGTAREGFHIQEVPDSFTIAAGEDSREVQISALAAGLTNGPKVVLLQVAPRDRYLLGNPGEAVLYAGNTVGETNTAGFDRWLEASTNGAMTSLADLAGVPPATLSGYLQAYAAGLQSIDDPAVRGVTLRIVDGRPELSAPGKFNAADLRWIVQSSAGLDQWADAGAAFVEVPDASGLKLLGQPLAPGDDKKFYRLRMMLDPGQLAGSRIAALTGATRYGMSGNGTWKSDAATGDLVSNGGSSGETSRIIASTTGPVRLDFEMEITGGNAADSFVFYIDGVQQAQAHGDPVRFQRELTGPVTRLLMWEFTKGTGQAIIRSTPQ